MALPTSGNITLQQIQNEFSTSGLVNSSNEAGLTLPTSMTDFYGLSAVTGLTLPLNYGSNEGFDLSTTVRAGCERTNNSWNQYVALAQAAGEGTSSTDNGYTTNAQSQYYRTNLVSFTPGPVRSVRNNFPTLTSGPYAGGRIGISCAWGINIAGVIVTMFDEDYWNTATHRGITPYGLPTFTEAAGSALTPATVLDQIILTDHMDRTLTLDPADFNPAVGNFDVNATDKNPAARNWNWIPTSNAAWGSFNPRSDGVSASNTQAFINAANLQWGTGNVTVTVTGYA